MGSRKPLVDDEQQQQKIKKEIEKKRDFRSRLMQEPCRHVGRPSFPFLSPPLYGTVHRENQPVIYTTTTIAALYRAANQHHHLMGFRLAH